MLRTNYIKPADKKNRETQTASNSTASSSTTSWRNYSCPNAACGILKINAILDTIDDALNTDDVIILLGNGHNN